MENDKLNNREKPPASISPVQENVEFFLTNRQNAAASTGIFHNGSSARADPMSFPYMPFPVTPFPWNHMHGTYQPYTHSIPETCGNLMVDLNQLHNLQNPPIDPNSINISSDIPSLYRQDLHFPEGNVTGLSYTHDKTGVADTLMNDSAHFNGFQNPDIDRNFTLIRGNASGAHEMTRQGVGEAHGSNIHGPQIKNFVDLGGSTTMLYHTQNSGEINIGNNDQVSGSQFGCPQKIDGSFLSLGIGGKTDAKSKFDLSSRESTGKLDKAVFPQQNTSHVRQGTGSSLNPGHNLGGGFSSFQNNGGGFRSPGHNAGGWTSSNSNVGVMCGADASLNSSPFHSLQMPQPDMQHGFPKSSNRNLGFVGNRNSRYANFDPYKGFIGELATSSGPFTSSSAGFIDSGQSGASGVTSESVKFIRTTTRPTQRFVETVQNSSPESFRVSSFIGLKGSSSRQGHSGQLFPASKDSAAQAVDESTQLHRRKRIQPAGQLFSANGDTAGGDLSSRRIDFQVTKDSAAQVAGNSLFPKRLGVQVHEQSATQAAGHGLFAGNQVPDSCVAYATGQGFYPKATQVRTASWPEPFSTDPRGPSVTTGCSQGLPLQFSNALLGPTSTSGQVVSTAKGYRLSQASNVLGRPSRKRDTLQPHPAAPRVQRRKRTRQPPILPSMPHPPQTAPAAAIPIPAPVPQIKWQGSDGLPQPTGQKCMLCKRDLSFTPEGPVHQPKDPPAVAVLSCGHTFHDHCLQLITPEDQSKNPPCIPCAIGEI